jgi:hypothetical protein
LSILGKYGSMDFPSLMMIVANLARFVFRDVIINRNIISIETKRSIFVTTSGGDWEPLLIIRLPRLFLFMVTSRTLSKRRVRYEKHIMVSFGQSLHVTADVRTLSYVIPKSSADRFCWESYRQLEGLGGGLGYTFGII